MAKLVAVCRDDEFPFERRQIPLMIEETLTMVMEIPETIISVENVNSTEVANFIKRYTCLTKNELKDALVVCKRDLFKLLAVMVPCVGCRKSVERLYNQLWESCQPAIEPLIIKPSGVLSLKDAFISDIKLIYALFYIHGSNLNDVVDTIPKSKRNRRCILHSLETHKARASGSWLDVWDLLSQECRDEVVLIDSDSLLGTLENYLRKHRFCSECKSKVLRAYSILAGDVDGDAEKGYCAGLYEGLKSCPKDRHIHVVCDTEFIAHLIGRAEPELAGGRRERHARTIDIAQEEVLTCLGIHLWERLHRLWQKLRAEEQTWQMLFYLGIEALRKSFETAVEEKQGISQLELVVEEISEAERVKEKRKENKRLKRKKRKEKLKAKNPCELESHVDEEQEEEEDDEKVCPDIEKESQCSDKDEKSSNDVCLSEDSGIQEIHSESSVSSSSQESCSPSPSSQGSSIDISHSDFKKSEKEIHNDCHLDRDNNNSVKFNNNGLLLKECPYSRKSKRSFNDSHSQQSVYYNQSYNNKCSKYSNQRNKNESNSDCECDADFIKQGKKGGYVQGSYNHRGNYRRNGYHNYDNNGYRTNYSTIGPRFKRLNQNYEDSRRSGDQVDSHSHCHAVGRGRGKQSGYKPSKDSPTIGKPHVPPMTLLQSKQSMDSGFESQSSSTSSSEVSSSCLPPDVDDEDELRLLKIMGWNSDENYGVSEQEIKEFSASLCDIKTQRQELRNNIREQFNKLTINNGLFCNC